MWKGRNQRWITAVLAAALTLAFSTFWLGSGRAAAQATTTTDCPTSTTVAPSTSTTGGNSTGAGNGTTTTSVAASTTTAVANTTAPTSAGTGGAAAQGASGLAFTGLNAISLSLFGVGTIVAGTLLVVSVRRRRRPGADSLGCFGLVALAYSLTDGTHHVASALSPALTCGPGANLPEAPMTILLPVVTGVMFGVFWLAARYRHRFDPTA